MDDNKKFESYKIPSRPEQVNERVFQKQFYLKPRIIFEEDAFAEIQISTQTTAEEPLQAQAIAPEIDQKRQQFLAMRQIARENYLRSNTSHVFYQQAILMKDFEDDFSVQAAFSAYFPYYQLMSYEQLRTYFTWRTKVRKGDIIQTSLSYVFVYIYELLNNIGVADPADGLDKLMAFWHVYRELDTTIDKYVLAWVKDYHVYYPLPRSFREFALLQGLCNQYPHIFFYDTDINHSLELYCQLSSYDIRKSNFYTEQTSERIEQCFLFVLRVFRAYFANLSLRFEDFIYQPSGKEFIWKPFGNALFHPWLEQEDRTVALSPREVYYCTCDTWSYTYVTPYESGKQLIGYILKEMEAVLRVSMHYKYKITADASKIDPKLVALLRKEGTSLDQLIAQAVKEFLYRINRKVITIDNTNLEKIRQDALDTQEKLLVQEEEEHTPEPAKIDVPPSKPYNTDRWASLWASLTGTEQDAIRILVQGGEIKHFADTHGMLLEVLIDELNQKALDSIQDTIMELGEGIEIYEDYREKLIEMVKRNG